jgi:hypothetical protein
MAKATSTPPGRLLIAPDFSLVRFTDATAQMHLGELLQHHTI